MRPGSRILVAGCGAIGSVFGGFLRTAGHDVTLLGREWHLDAIRARGLRIDGLWGEHQVSGFTLATHTDLLSGLYDLILISVKSYDTEAMVQEVAPHLAPGGLVVSLQNGLGNVETIAVAVGASRSLGSSILVGSTIPEPGRVTVTVQAAAIVLGPLDSTSVGAMEHASACARLLTQAGIPSEATDRVLSYLWAKVLYNAPLNPLGALLQIHYGALGDAPELRAIMDAIIDEAFCVAQAKAVPLAWATAQEYRREFYEKLVPATYGHRSSMLQDLERGRRTEIQAINGAVGRFGAELGVPTPCNQLMTHLISWRERNEWK